MGTKAWRLWNREKRPFWESNQYFSAFQPTHRAEWAILTRKAKLLVDCGVSTKTKRNAGIHQDSVVWHCETYGDSPVLRVKQFVSVGLSMKKERMKCFPSNPTHIAIVVVVELESFGWYVIRKRNIFRQSPCTVYVLFVHTKKACGAVEEWLLIFLNITGPMSS